MTPAEIFLNKTQTQVFLIICITDKKNIFFFLFRFIKKKKKKNHIQLFFQYKDHRAHHHFQT